MENGVCGVKNTGKICVSDPLMERFWEGKVAEVTGKSEHQA